jgi:signal transduction histidine kinase
MAFSKVKGWALQWASLQAGADYFREQSLLVIALLVGLSELFWIGQCVSLGTISARSGLLLLAVLFGSGWMVVALYKNYFLWATASFLVGHLAILAAMAWYLKDLTLGFLCILSISMTGSLVGPLGALMVAGLASGMLAFLQVATPEWQSSGGMIPILAMVFFLTAVISGQSAQGSYTALEAARLSSQEAEKRAEEARQHRGELHRTLRSLDLAYAKLQQVNEELFEARESAARALRFKSEFTAQISHELRTPLNLILGFSETMAFAQDSYGTRLPPAYLRDVTEIYRNSRHLLTLIDDVLDLSKLDAGRMGLHFEPVRLEDLLQQVVETLQPLAHAKGISLRLEIFESLPSLWLDRGRIHQVLLNLTSNAARVTRAGSIVLHAVQTEGEIIVSVQDTGPGILAEALAQVFEDFQQVGETAGTSGLGLAVSRRIVELHGGRIGVESEVGHGSTFFFALPLKKSIVLPLMETNPLASIKASLPAVLVVGDEDSEDVRLLRRHLEGFAIAVAKNLTEAEQLVGRMNARAIIAGEQDASALDASSLPVPLLACSLSGFRQKDQASGVAGVLHKPLSLRAVQSILQEVAPAARRVLILAENPSDARLVERMLPATSECRVQRAYTFSEAQDYVRTAKPEVIFWDDPQMGEESAKKLEWLGAEEEMRHIPVLLIRDGVAAEDSDYGTRVGLYSPRRLTATETLNYLQALLSTVPPAQIERRTSIPPS